MNNVIKFDSASTTRMIFDMVDDFTNINNMRTSVMVFVCSPETGISLRETECIPMEWVDPRCASIMGCVVNVCYQMPFGILGVMDYDAGLIYDDSFKNNSDISILGEGPIYHDVQSVSPLPGRFIYEGQYFGHFFPVKDFYNFKGKIEYV